MVVGGRRVPTVGVVDDGGVVLLAAVPARQLMLENILGLRSTWYGENAVAHRCLHSSAPSSSPDVHQAARLARQSVLNC